jgi:hypothetical protein
LIGDVCDSNVEEFELMVDGGWAVGRWEEAGEGRRQEHERGERAEKAETGEF